MAIVRQSKACKSSFLGKIEKLGRMLQVDFISCGMEAQKAARLHHTYKDRTGNLTSSIGYAVAQNSKVLGEAGGTSQGSYQMVSNGHLGVQEARAIAQQESEGADALQLVVFAGMPYAKYVEQKGYSVLEPARLYVGSELEESIKETIRIVQNG